MKNKKIIYILIVVVILSIYLFSLIKPPTDDLDTSIYNFNYENGVYSEEITSLAPVEEGYMSPQVSLFYGDNVIDMKEPLIYMYDTTIPLTYMMGIFGINTNANLTVYYDYLPVKFKVGDSDEYVTHYAFDVEDGQGVFVPITLDESLPKDSNMHTITFVYEVGYGKHVPSDELFPSSSYGMALRYNLKYNENTDESSLNNTFSSDLYEPEQPDRTYSSNGAGFVINTDYIGFKQPDDDSMLLPPTHIQVNANQQIPFMYNIGNPTDYMDNEPMESPENCLFFLQLNGEPILVDGEPFKVVELQADMLSTGQFTITAPTEPGLYDLTGYAVYNPFEPISLESKNIVLCPRFTIEVI